MTDEKRETDLVRCEGCQEMVRPLTEHAVSLVAATVVSARRLHFPGRRINQGGPY